MLKGNFVIKENTFIINLNKVDFITFKLNEENFGEYWIKFHIGGKEARYICDIDELKDILEQWCGMVLEVEELEE